MKETTLIEDAFHDYIEHNISERTKNATKARDLKRIILIMDLFLNYELFLSFLAELEEDHTDFDFKNPDDLKRILDMMHRSYEGYFESEEDWIAEKGEELKLAKDEEEILTWKFLSSNDNCAPFFFTCSDSTRDGYHIFLGA